MVTNIRILESWFPLARSLNVEYLKDITSIHATLGTQLERNYNCIKEWKHHREEIIEKMKPYITSVFRIIHPRPLAAFFTYITEAWAFKLGFLWDHNGSNPELYHPVCCPLCNPHTRTTFPRLAYSLMDNDRKEKPHSREDSMIYTPSRVRDGSKKKNLMVSELHNHIELKTPHCLAHNIYEGLLRAMYHRPRYMYFDKIRHPYDGLTPMRTPTHLEGKKVFMLERIRLVFDGMTKHVS